MLARTAPDQPAQTVRASTHPTALLYVMPQAKVLLADRGHNAVFLRNTLIAIGITACIPSRKSRKVLIGHDAVLSKVRLKAENMLGLLKDCRRIAMCIDRRADIFLSACVLAATVFSGYKSRAWQWRLQ